MKPVPIDLSKPLRGNLWVVLVLDDCLNWQPVLDFCYSLRSFSFLFFAITLGC